MHIPSARAGVHSRRYFPNPILSSEFKFVPRFSEIRSFPFVRSPIYSNTDDELI